MAMERLKAQMARTLYNEGDFIQPDHKYGEIPGIKFGHAWNDRKGCSRARVHTPTFAGICAGDVDRGCRSIVLAGGYADDEDYGDTIIYTGTGGRGEREGDFHFGAKEIIEDQDPNHSDNASLRVSVYTKCPVRVVRGENAKSPYAPMRGYRYDGLYVVDAYEYTTGNNPGGFRVCKFKLSRFTRPGETLPPIPKRW